MYQVSLAISLQPELEYIKKLNINNFPSAVQTNHSSYQLASKCVTNESQHIS